jgi:hypothetical protein
MKHIKIEHISHYLFVDNDFEIELYDLIELLSNLKVFENYIDEKTAEYLEKCNIITKNSYGTYDLKNDNLRKVLLNELLELKKNAK